MRRIYKRPPAKLQVRHMPGTGKLDMFAGSDVFDHVVGQTLDIFSLFPELLVITFWASNKLVSIICVNYIK